MKEHGGKRPNSGRPQVDDKKVSVSVALESAYIEDLENENRSAAVNAGLSIVIPAIQGREDEAREKFENFLNERK